MLDTLCILGPVFTCNGGTHLFYPLPFPFSHPSQYQVPSQHRGKLLEERSAIREWSRLACLPPISNTRSSASPLITTSVLCRNTFLKISMTKYYMYAKLLLLKPGQPLSTLHPENRKEFSYSPELISAFGHGISCNKDRYMFTCVCV